MSNSNRRNFIKSTLLAVGTLPVVGLVARAQTAAPAAGAKPAGGDLKLLEETDPQAKALGYYKDASKVDTKKWAKRAPPEAQKEQFCRTCTLYKKVKGDGAAEVGECTLFMAPTKRHVMGGGWCNSWIKKPS